MFEFLRRIFEIVFSHNEPGSDPSGQRQRTVREELFFTIRLLLGVSIPVLIPPLLIYAFQHFQPPAGYQDLINLLDSILILVMFGFFIFILLIFVLLFIGLLVRAIIRPFHHVQTRWESPNQDEFQPPPGVSSRTSTVLKREHENQVRIQVRDRRRQQHVRNFQRFVLLGMFLVAAVAYYIVLNHGNLPFDIPSLPEPSP